MHNAKTQICLNKDIQWKPYFWSSCIINTVFCLENLSHLITEEAFFFVLRSILYNFDLVLNLEKVAEFIEVPEIKS